jgi:hypothetical protein
MISTHSGAIHKLVAGKLVRLVQLGRKVLQAQMAPMELMELLGPKGFKGQLAPPVILVRWELMAHKVIQVLREMMERQVFRDHRDRKGHKVTLVQLVLRVHQEMTML